MPNTKTSVMLAMAAGVMFSGCLAAAERAGPDAATSPEETRRAAERAEANLERRIQDRTERAKREAAFNRLDQDGDGYLSEGEWKITEDLQPAPEVLDRDRDGRISRTEFAAVETAKVEPDDPDVPGSPNDR
jgi:hypothetical protein